MVIYMVRYAGPYQDLWLTKCFLSKEKAEEFSRFKYQSVLVELEVVE